MSSGYEARFYEDLGNTALPSARRVLPALFALYPVRNAVDLGCGDGSWLAVCRELGAAHVLGVDGPWVETAQLRIPAGDFLRRDLHRPFEVPGRFDLAISLEVAEHLPPERAAGFVATLCGLAPVVLFSAAPPGQGGTHHLNERWPAWWAGLFAAQGFRCLDILRLRFWEDAAVTWWYRQNLLLFARPEVLAAHPALAEAAAQAPTRPPALVHPELFRQVLRRAEPRFSRWAKMAPAALRRSLARRFSPRQA